MFKHELVDRIPQTTTRHMREYQTQGTQKRRIHTHLQTTYTIYIQLLETSTRDEKGSRREIKRMYRAIAFSETDAGPKEGSEG